MTVLSTADSPKGPSNDLPTGASRRRAHPQRANPLPSPHAPHPRQRLLHPTPARPPPRPHHPRHRHPPRHHHTRHPRRQRRRRRLPHPLRRRSLRTRQDTARLPSLRRTRGPPCARLRIRQLAPGTARRRHRRQNLRPVHQQRHPRPHHLRRDGGRKQQRRDGGRKQQRRDGGRKHQRRANTSAGTAAEDPSANPSADHTLVACLRNRAAAVQAALETLANAGNAGANDAGAALSGIAIICAGERLATSPSVEDSFTAGACVYPLLDALPPDQLFLESGARLALRIFDAYGRDPARAFADSPHADFLSSIGYTGDLDFAAELDADSTVPRATRDAEGRIVVRR